MAMLQFRESPLTGAAAFQQFARLVFGDSVLQAALCDMSDLEAFPRQTARLGAEQGLLSTAADVGSARRAERWHRARFT